MSEYVDLDKVQIVMDLPRLGELIGAVAQKMCDLRGMEKPDFDGQEMRDLAMHGWNYVCHMHDRAEFARSVKDDLESLETL